MARDLFRSRPSRLVKGLLFVVALSMFTRPALAHRLDEYLQATILSIEPATVQATMRLVPGVAVAPDVIASIDSNGDGVLSAGERRRYAEAVMADLQLKEDAEVVPLHLTSERFPSLERMKLGTGEIEIGFAADLPFRGGRHHLTFENHHQRNLSVYLVNSLVPHDNRLQLEGQTRNQNQSVYQVTLAEGDAGASHAPTWSGFSGAFRLGVRHIAEGTDHLLFLLTLLLPAPLLALRGRWREHASLRRTVVQTLRIVTAFTLGHSLTLALSGFGLVRLPSRPVEILIAVSILVSALHALRPLFPGREAGIAAAFGLVHGLAFASALSELGVTGWYRLVTVLGFNIGIEAMQLAVVAMTLPALILLSRTSWYSAFRIAGALFTVVASVAWMIERVLNKPSVVGDDIAGLAHHGELLAGVLWAFTVLASLRQGSLPMLRVDRQLSDT